MKTKLQFELGKTYELVDPKGFSSSFDGNVVLSQEIMETGGCVTVRKVQNGNAVSLVYGDGSVNEFASLLGSEVRFFREYKLSNLEIGNIVNYPHTDVVAPVRLL